LGVVCLSVDNGHGKSAILDAITWALWGETRMGKRDHEQLIRIGADEMAAHIGTISYEVFTRISERVPRLYVGQAAGSSQMETGKRSS